MNAAPRYKLLSKQCLQVDMVYTVDTVFTSITITIQTALHCLNISMYAYNIYIVRKDRNSTGMGLCKMIKKYDGLKDGWSG